MRNDLEEAEIAYRRAIQERPAFTLALLNLGRLLSAEKKFEAAIEPLTEAVKSSSASVKNPKAGFPGCGAAPTKTPQPTARQEESKWQN